MLKHGELREGYLPDLFGSQLVWWWVTCFEHMPGNWDGATEIRELMEFVRARAPDRVASWSAKTSDDHERARLAREASETAALPNLPASDPACLPAPGTGTAAEGPGLSVMRQLQELWEGTAAGFRLPKR